MTTDNIDYDHAIALLEKQKAKLLEEGKYIKAKKVDEKIKSLTLESRNNDLNTLHEKQFEERLSMEEAHVQDFNIFNSEWDRKIRQHNKQSKQTENAMIEKHEQVLDEELNDFQTKLLSRKPKWSKQVLDERVIEARLSKQGKFTQAHYVKKKLRKLEDKDLEKMRQLVETKVMRHEEKVMKRQAAELASLRKKHKRKLQELKNQRKHDENILVQRYQNLKQDLINQQKTEQRIIDKPNRRSGTMELQVNTAVVRCIGAPRPSSTKGIRKTKAKRVYKKRHGNKLIASPEKLRGFGGTSSRLCSVSQPFLRSPRLSTSTIKRQEMNDADISDDDMSEDYELDMDKETEIDNGHEIPCVQTGVSTGVMNMSMEDSGDAIRMAAAVEMNPRN